MKGLNDIYTSFETGIRSAKAVDPKLYLKSIGLDYTELRIGFNSGQFHHREEQKIKDHYESLGLLTKSDAGVKQEGLTAYTVFGRYGIVFPLFNQQNQVVNFFAIRFKMVTPQEDYLNESGLYPCYPNPNTKTLYIVPTILDAASLLQSKALENKESVLALHEGKLLPQHREAISQLEHLERIIIIKR
jgi:hypothetical protein